MQVSWGYERSCSQIIIMQHDKPFILPIKEVITENSRVKSFVFDYDFPGKPGQFVMVWIPGYDEKPFGIVKIDGRFMITVAAVGDSTKALHKMRVGDKLGFRGPYGSYFSLSKSKKPIAFVAGGYGMASLALLAQDARKLRREVHLFLGARNKNELLYLSWAKKIGLKLHLSTDDGSAGFKGYNTDLFAKFVNRHAELVSASHHQQIPNQVRDDVLFEKVYIVGPEIMEVKVAKTCSEKNIPFEVSLERYMKCGFGICGQCCVDPTGWRMCVEGPVLNQDQLKRVTEFGKYHRSPSGKLIHY